MFSSLLYNENPGHDDRGFLSLQHFAMQGHASSPLGHKSMRAQYANASESCNKYRQINRQLSNEVISRCRNNAKPPQPAAMLSNWG